MPFSVTDILYGGVVPALAAGLLMLILRWLLPDAFEKRYTVVVAFVAGFFVGYGMLSLSPWIPTAHWHWLPWMLLAGTVVGPISCVNGVYRIERWLLYALLALGVGWMLVPTWEDLEPARWIHQACFVLYVVGWMAVMEPLGRRSAGPLLPAVLTATLTAAAVILALAGSLRFAQIALAGAASLFGIFLVSCWDRQPGRLSGIGLVFSILVIGSLLVGRVNSFSDVPLVSYALVPLAPLGLWLTEAKPLARFPSWQRSLAGGVVALAILGTAILDGYPGGMEYPEWRVLGGGGLRIGQARRC